jgi:branched-subunit amino acid transport protein
MSKHTYYYHQPPEPLQLTHTSTTSIPHVHADAYGPLASDPDPDPDAPLHRLLAQEDLALKHRIRLLRFLSRLVSALLAAITLSLLATTIEKFLLTRHTYYVVAGVRRTAWATDSVTWYTYMYAGVAAVSVVLDLAVLGCYAKDVRSANRAAEIGRFVRSFCAADP